MLFNIGGIIGPLALAYFITFLPFRTGMLYFMIIPALVAAIITIVMRYPKNIKEIFNKQLEEGL